MISNKSSKREVTSRTLQYKRKYANNNSSMNKF